MTREPDEDRDDRGDGVIAFIGIGTMGAPMATHVLALGRPLRVHDAVADATMPLVDAGATAHRTAGEAASGAQSVLLSLPGPAQILDAVLGADGVLTAQPLPEMIIDLSTNSVDAVRELRERCAAVGVAFVDAPVSGGVAKARAGSLTVLVGAEPSEFAAAGPILRAIGDDIFHVGAPGTGTIAKIVNNQLFLAAGVLVQEAYVLGAALGMSPTELHTIIAASSAAPYAKLAPLLLGRRFDDVIFRLDIATKDVALAIDTADRAGVDIPLTRAAGAVYDAARDAGDGDLVFHATLRELERRADVELPTVAAAPEAGRSGGGRTMTVLPASAVDLSDGQSFRGGFPHGFFTWLRAHDPVHWHEPTAKTPDDEGFWVVSRHADVMSVFRDPTTYSSDRAGGLRERGGTGIKDERIRRHDPEHDRRPAALPPPVARQPWVHTSDHRSARGRSSGGVRRSCSTRSATSRSTPSTASLESCRHRRSASCSASRKSTAPTSSTGSTPASRPTRHRSCPPRRRS